MTIATTPQVEDTISAQRTPYGVAILLGLNRTGRHIYEGTVPAVTKAARRRKNKAVRSARRANR